MIKTPEQIDGIKASCRLAAACLDFIEPYMKPGIATETIDSLIAEYIHDHGAASACLGYVGHGAKPYPKSTCISINEVVCHGIPSERLLADGDIVNVDVTTVLNGYFGDTSRTFLIGNVSAGAARLAAVTKDALHLGIEQVKPGNHFGDIGYAIAELAHSAGYSVVYQCCGHGVGVEFHESPTILHIDNKGNGEVMKEGMIFTIEPMLNEGVPEAKVLADGWTVVTTDGGLSAQFEHTVLVTKDGAEILTPAGLLI